MSCPECQFDHREGAIFRSRFGASLELACPICQSSNPPDSKFHPKHGQKLTQPSKLIPKEISIDEKIEKIQKYFRGA